MTDVPMSPEVARKFEQATVMLRAGIAMRSGDDKAIKLASHIVLAEDGGTLDYEYEHCDMLLEGCRIMKGESPEQWPALVTLARSVLAGEINVHNAR